MLVSPCPCILQCPEYCEGCIYVYCSKPVDYELVRFNYYERNESFDAWFRAYFSLKMR